MVVGIVDDISFADRAEQLAGAVGGGGDHRQPAGQRFENYERARIVKGRVDQKIGGEVAIAPCRGNGRRKSPDGEFPGVELVFDSAAFGIAGHQ